MSMQKALQYAAQLCSRSERCKVDIIDKLQQWNLSDEEVTHILDYLEEESFLDENRYACLFARDKMRFNHWGKQKIRVALTQKRIPKTIIDQALSALSQTEYLCMLREQMAKKHATLFSKNNAPQQLKVQLINFGRSRGYEPELWNVIDEIMQS